MLHDISRVCGLACEGESSLEEAVGRSDPPTLVTLERSSEELGRRLSERLRLRGVRRMRKSDE